MPTYEYTDTRTGKTVELVKTIAERDDVPPHLKRIVAPNIGGPGLMGSNCREPGVDEAVPKAFREMELQGHSYRKICREAGWSVDHIRRVWSFLAFLVAMLVMTAQAADLTTGYSFGSTEQVTASKLNAIAGSATINSAFITAKSAATPASDGSDQFVVSQGGTLKRMTMTSLLGNTNLIASQAVGSTVLTNDYVLVLEGATLVKVQLGTLLSKIAGTVASSTGSPNTNNFIFTANNGATALYSSIGAIGGYSFTSQLFAVSGAAIANVAHLLPATPQFVKWVLVMTNTGSDNGYTFGDEVPVEPMMNNVSSVPIFIGGANLTNAFLYWDSSKTPAVVRKSDGSPQPITTTNWRAKCYARYFYY